MKIAIDASRAVNETAGIGRHTLELVKNLIEIEAKGLPFGGQKNQYLLIFSYMRETAGKAKIIKSLQGPNVQTKVFKIPGNLKEKVWGWKIPWYKTLLEKADIFYAPSFFEVNMGLDIPQVVTIYDLTTFIFPQHRGEDVSNRLNQRTKEACQKAAKIITVSKSTAKDLQRYLKISRAKIKVIYPGQNELAKPAANLPNNLKKNSFILAVGTIEPRKNLIGLFKAYALLPPALQEKYPLVICGAKGWNTGEIDDTFIRLKLAGRVKFLGYVTDAVLAKLYKEAAVFVYPSFYEGFGFPVLEAMSCGAAVVTAKVSSLPEVAGKAAVLVNPEKSIEISSAIQRLIEHREEADHLKILAKKQAEKFSWHKAACQTLKLFEETVK